MAAYLLGKQTAGCHSPHDWLMILAMDLTALCDMLRRGENDTKGCHLAGFGEDIAFACHFVATHPPPPSHPVGVLLVLAMSVNNYLKWWEIQLAIHPIVGR